MAQIGYGYGSEYHLMRFLGHHRHLLESLITEQTGYNPPFNWLDFEFAKRKKNISGDSELKGIGFLKELINEDVYDAIEKEYKSYGINKIDTWQNWDAIAVADNTILLVEAKAHTEELKSDKSDNGGKSKDKIIRFMKEQLPEFPVNEEWLRDYYQLANRLAITALFDKHLSKVGMHARTLCLFFENGYYERKKDKEGNVIINNLDANREKFEKAIKEELDTLKITHEAIKHLVTPNVFIDANPNK